MIRFLSDGVRIRADQTPEQVSLGMQHPSLLANNSLDSLRWSMMT
jgi:hypothetical protein